LVAATHVDHIKAIEFGGAEYDQDNLQSMCKPCHERKTRHDEYHRKIGS
jgi:5-methylcytosine-specific restriction protein A